MLISVIVPVYNVEDYLHYAMESLFRQTYKNFEIILVDDGSTDNSGVLCDEYSRKYDNVYTFHKENGGLSDARNFGVQKAKGDWVTFLDPDDYLEDYALELMIEAQKRYNVNLVATVVKGVYKHNCYDNHTLIDHDLRVTNIYNSKNALSEMYYDKKATVSACGKLYRKLILEKSPFPLGKIYEDFYIVSQHLLDEEKVFLSPLESYKYYKREGSIVTSPFTEKKYEFFEAVENNRKVLREKGIDDKEVWKALVVKNIEGSYHIINLCISSNKIKNLYYIRKKIKDGYLSFLMNGRVSKKIKIKHSMFLLSPSLYAIAYRVLKKS